MYAAARRCRARPRAPRSPDQAVPLGVPDARRGLQRAIGGVATIIGTPPMAIFAAADGKAQAGPSDCEWMAIGLPIARCCDLLWLLLVRVCFVLRGSLPGVRELVAREAPASAPGRPVNASPSRPGARGAGLDLREPRNLAVTLPASRSGLPGLSDAGIAIGAAVVLFVLSDIAPGRGGRARLGKRRADSVGRVVRSRRHGARRGVRRERSVGMDRHQREAARRTTRRRHRCLALLFGC